LKKKDNGSLQINRLYYDESYYRRHEIRLDQSDRFTRVKIKRVFDLLRPSSNEVILDLGSGVGTVMIALTGAGAKPIGFDYSLRSLQLAQTNFRRMSPGAVFRGVCCDGSFFGIKSGTLDAIAAVDFTEHLDNTTLVPTLEEVYRVLKKNGRFVVYTPSRTHLFELLKRHNIILKEDKSHIGLRTMDEYLTLLSRCGFTIADSHFAPTDIPVFNAIEAVAMKIPIVGNLAKRRICICATK
jgi:cyclopropane fatty-acyl-phospholipid synthase-like methyltransferase